MTAGTVDGSHALVMLRNLGAEARPVVRREVVAFGLDVTALAKKGSPIKHGRLRRSIHPETFEDGPQITGVVGTNVEYAARFEYGWHGTETVKSFTRRQTMAFGKPITPRIVTVREFTRQANTAQRAFLAPALEAATPPLAQRISTAMRKVPGVSP